MVYARYVRDIFGVGMERRGGYGPAVYRVARPKTQRRRARIDDAVSTRISTLSTVLGMHLSRATLAGSRRAGLAHTLRATHAKPGPALVVPRSGYFLALPYDPLCLAGRIDIMGGSAQ